jgi:hypothetical protein
VGLYANIRKWRNVTAERIVSKQDINDEIRKPEMGRAMFAGRSRRPSVYPMTSSTCNDTSLREVDPRNMGEEIK